MARFAGKLPMCPETAIVAVGGIRNWGGKSADSRLGEILLQFRDKLDCIIRENFLQESQRWGVNLDNMYS